ncbi:DEAD/DEAH box helicase [Knoellia sinensis KCTC 19936]|uniref:DEAD/DEAH box helicase n=1 Tax=Knoellia sinensis KCTC 19936 TaxID=1385520 RepID=A0A0A0JE56_9MICO|nr:DEAD/DEAH box helicase family protein [Knoellia sinensis]KGN33901.1 DEAD/DEAH box helicase [Knoellia sinensis KCTC 19936]
MLQGPPERDTCRDVILPALAKVGWADELIRPEYPVTAMRVVSGSGVERELGAGRVDYVLEVVSGLPVAVVEAKRAYRSAADGVQQAVRYAEQLDVPIAYASNGKEIIERDLLAGTERVVDSFMTPAEAWSRYASAHGLDKDGAELLQQPFNRIKRTASGDVIEPRWYQTVAVHRVLSAIARGERRILLLMATGTGKTFTAMQLVQKLRAHARIVNPGRNHRVLYLADRDALVEQPRRKDFTVAFGADPLWRVAGGANRSREIYFATYQALAGGDDEGKLFRDYPSDFFDVVIVDECHRGSAAENSSWRQILEHFDSAVQVGLTATPKQGDTVDTFRYFGEPVFTYSLRQGIEDGFLAPYRVRRVLLSPDTEGWEPDPGQLDRFGREIPEGRYSTRDFERVVRLLMRTDLVASFLSRILRRDPTARMIIFCVDQQHADDMRRAMVNANPTLVAADPEWVVRIVGAEGEKVRLLEAFSDPERTSPVVATTSRLLSTGVDIEDLKYVVLFRPVGSAVEFKQIIGRGTRLYPDKGKASFEIVDFVGATSHFADPDFDGFPSWVVDNTEDDDPGAEDEDTGGDPTDPSPSTVADPAPPFTVTDPVGEDEVSPPDGAGHQRPEKLTVDDGHFFVVAEAVQVPDTSTGKLVLTEYGEYVAGRVRQLASGPHALADRWARQPSRQEVLAELKAADIDLSDLSPTGEDGVDPLDVLMQVAWNVPARTRAERVRRAREAHHVDMEARSETARAVLNALLDRYAVHGVDEITSPEVVRLPPISDLGSPRDIVSTLGGGVTLGSVINEVQEWIYSDKSVS